MISYCIKCKNTESKYTLKISHELGLGSLIYLYATQAHEQWSELVSKKLNLWDSKSKHFILCVWPVTVKTNVSNSTEIHTFLQELKSNFTCWGVHWSLRYQKPITKKPRERRAGRKNLIQSLSQPEWSTNSFRKDCVKLANTYFCLLITLAAFPTNLIQFRRVSLSK